MDTLAGWSPLELSELKRWSLEQFYQYLAANEIRFKKMEAERKSKEGAQKSNNFTRR